MKSAKITVINKSGIHLRPASELSKIAAHLKSDITLTKGEKTVNPKSVLMLMSSGIVCGDEIIVECEGETEAEDLQVILDAINSGLGE